MSKVVTTKVEVEFSGSATLFLRTEIKGIEGWDVSNWNDMGGLFYSSNKVNVDLSGWDVSKVKIMGLTMVLGDVNPNINNWDVSSATNMTSLVISGNSNYIEGMDLSGWDVSKVTNCNNFYNNITDWPESKRPNFTNCNPD